MNEEKFKELILYIAQKCVSHQKYGKTKLNKILFFSDFITYAKRGESITGADYFKLSKGPAPRQMKPILEKMLLDGDLVLVPRQVFAFTERRPTALREPNLSLFSGDEIAVVDEVIELLKDKYAEEVSDLSHYYLGWQLVNERETIPYESIYWNVTKKEDITEQDIEIGYRVAKQYNLPVE